MYYYIEAQVRQQTYLAGCRRMLSFLRLRLGTRMGRLCLPTKLAAEPLEDHSQVEPGIE
jgi:hypothetical protein